MLVVARKEVRRMDILNSVQAEIVLLNKRMLGNYSS